MIMKARIHGRLFVIKLIDNKPHIIDKQKGKYVWQETIITPTRMKRFKEVTEFDLVLMLLEV